MASTYELIVEVVDKTSKPINEPSFKLKSTEKIFQVWISKPNVK